MGGMTGLLLLLWAGVTVGSVVDLQKRIIGGGDCPDDERRYHVQLRDTSPDRFICGGSLIGAQWVLTAAHCYTQTVYAVVGVHPGKDKEKVEVVNYHHFKDSNGKEHDLMLMEIKKSQKKHDLVQLPNCASPPKKGAVVEIAGHASTTLRHDKKREHDESKTLQCANTDVVDCNEYRTCVQKKYPAILKSKDHEEWLCFKRDKVDISRGDSGGGVVFKNMIYGVIVLLGDGDYACVAAAASMNICHVDYQKWIYKTIGISPVQG